MQCERVNDEKNIIQYHRALTFDESEDMSERHGGGLPTEEELLELLRNSYTGYGEENPGAMYPGDQGFLPRRITMSCVGDGMLALTTTCPEAQS